MDIQRFLIGLGLVILIVGIAWRIFSRIGIGRLPGGRHRDPARRHQLLFPARHLHRHQHRLERHFTAVQSLTPGKLLGKHVDTRRRALPAHGRRRLR